MEKPTTTCKITGLENFTTIELDQDGSEFACRFHPTDWFHEVGCEHMEWTIEQLRDALITCKKGALAAAKRYYKNDD